MGLKVFRIGIVYALLSNAVSALNAIGMALLIPKIGVYTIIAARYVFLAYISLPNLVMHPEYLTNLSTVECLLLVMVSLSLGSMSISGYLAFNYAPPLDVNALVSTNPAIMMIIACIFLKEKLDPFKVVIILTIVGCALLIVQPEFIFGTLSDLDPKDRLLGSTLAICSAFLSTIGYALIRKLKHVPLSLINIVQGVLISFFTTLIFYSFMPVPTTMIDTLLFIFCTVCGSLGRALNAAALQKEEATLITAIGSVAIVMVMVLQIIVLEIYPNWVTVFGSLLLVICIVLLTLKDDIKEKFQKWRSNDEEIPILQT